MRRLLEANGWTQVLGGKHVVKMTKHVATQSLNVLVPA